MLISIGLLLIGFVLLIKGADFLVTGASAIARRLKLSELMIGLTIVAFGTSAPELSVSVVSAFKGHTDIALANVIGSNICNILLILGVSSLIVPLTVTKGTVNKEIPLSLLASCVIFSMANDRLIDKAAVSSVSRSEGIVLMFFFIVFLYYSMTIAKDAKEDDQQVEKERRSVFFSVSWIILGLLCLIVGGKWIVDGAVVMAGKLGMSENLIGLTIVAVGTSLPELATSAVAAYKRKADIAVGNIVGSNIFNIFFILAASSFFAPLPVNEHANQDMAILIIAGLMLFIFMFTLKIRILDRAEGLLFLICYAAYTVFVIQRG